MTITISTTTETIYTVSQLNTQVKSILEQHFTYVLVEGEISNFIAPHSGHWYFSIKDCHAQVRCAMFRASQHQLDCFPKEGMQVFIKARISLYTARGEYQLIVESIEERGEGQLRRAYEALWKKLKSAGLFDVTCKKTLPSIPTCVGIVTSPTGAVICDILTILQRRFPCLPIIIYPALVQGKTAATSIICALQTAIKRQECDVIILARGGGSLEDLWCFNDEMLAHIIYECPIPVISGIGHEVDFTIADFIADLRAPTPSAAAEMLTLEAHNALPQLQQFQQALQTQIAHKIALTHQYLSWMYKQLEQQHPKHYFQQKIQQLDQNELILSKLQHAFLNHYRNQLVQNSLALRIHAPLQPIQSLQKNLNHWKTMLQQWMMQYLNQQQAMLSQFTAQLKTLSPISTLKRGYAIITFLDNQTILYQFEKVKIGDTLNIHLAQGIIRCQIEHIESR